MRVCVENFPGLCCDRRFRTSLCPASGSGDDSNERFLVSVLILLVKIYTPLFGHVVVVVASLWNTCQIKLAIIEALLIKENKPALNKINYPQGNNVLAIF